MPSSVVKVKGGEKYKALLAKIAAQKVGVKVGILADATTTDGEHIATYAAANEFGAKKVFEDRVVTIPARPFMRQSVAKHQEEWLGTVAKAMRKQPDNAAGAMHIVGAVMRADIVQGIESGEFKPNAAATIKAKEKKGKTDPDHPLIDTGQMMEAVDYEVVKL